MHDYVVLHQKTHRTDAFGRLFLQTRHVDIVLVCCSSESLTYTALGLMAFAWTTFTNIGSVLVYFQYVSDGAIQSSAKAHI